MEGPGGGEAQRVADPKKILRNYIRDANPTIASYNASTLKIYDVPSSLVCFENKNNIIYVL
jgi:hypothetical protein